MRHELFAASELAPGEMRRAQVGGVSVVVIRTSDGSLHALRDVCAHMGARLSDGVMHPAAEAAPGGGYRLSETIVISCPWHGFEFDVESGLCIADAGVRTRSYPVVEEDGLIFVER